jgi:hypothetical protein
VPCNGQSTNHILYFAIHRRRRRVHDNINTVRILRFQFAQYRQAWIFRALNAQDYLIRRWVILFAKAAQIIFKSCVKAITWLQDAHGFMITLDSFFVQYSAHCHHAQNRKNRTTKNRNEQER